MPIPSEIKEKERTVVTGDRRGPQSGELWELTWRGKMAGGGDGCDEIN